MMKTLLPGLFMTEYGTFLLELKAFQEALSNAQEVLELLVEEYQQDGKPLPQPKPLVTISQIA